MQPEDSANDGPTATDWRAALGVSTAEELRAWGDRARKEELVIHNDMDLGVWTLLKTGIDGFRVEWRHVPDSKFRLYRFTTVLEGVYAPDAYHAAAKSLGGPDSFAFGDRSVSFCGRLFVFDFG